ncbi:MAG: hypothetical protein ACUVX8_15735 [Candidatus Zipacnadales bacterium]
MIRLHKHAALLVTKDVEALSELLEMDTIRLCLGPKLSPTVTWIDHRQFDKLHEMLLRAGYTPKVVHS